MRYLKNKGKILYFHRTISYHKYIQTKQSRRGRNMLQLNYKLTDEDYIEFNEFHQLIHSEVGKRNQHSCDSDFHSGKSRNNVDRYRSNCIMHFFNCMCNTG